MSTKAVSHKITFTGPQGLGLERTFCGGHDSTHNNQEHPSLWHPRGSLTLLLHLGLCSNVTSFMKPPLTLHAQPLALLNFFSFIIVA